MDLGMHTRGKGMDLGMHTRGKGMDLGMHTRGLTRKTWAFWTFQIGMLKYS